MPRRTRWIDALVGFQVATGGQGTQTLFPGISPDELRNGTIVRTIGLVDMYTVTVGGAQGVQGLDMGMGVISQEAIGAGVYPDPNDADDYPVRGWLYRHRCAVAQSSNDPTPLTHCVWDVRSQRKLDTGAYYLIANSTPLNGTTFTVELFGLVRTLVLMP